MPNGQKFNLNSKRKINKPNSKRQHEKTKEKQFQTKPQLRKISRQ